MVLPTEAMIEAGARAIDACDFHGTDNQKKAAEAFRAMQAAAPVGEVNRVARAMIVPLGYSADVDWSRVWVGDNTDSIETGSLEHLCKSLAAAALAALRDTTPADVDQLAALLCDDHESRVLAGREFAPSYADSPDDVKAYWRRIAVVRGGQG